MAESTLSVEYVALVEAVSRFLGYGATASNLTSAQLTEIDAIVQAGVRQFYYPPRLPGEREAHAWSFLKLYATLTTAASDYTYDLPDDCGGVSGHLYYAADSGKAPVVLIGPAQVLAMRLQTSSNGVPRYGAVRPKAAAGSTGQRFELLLWPTPDAIYTLTYEYHALVGKLTSAAPYPMGGMQHGETILASCLAQAELSANDARGDRWNLFFERLTASIEVDRRTNAPELLGYNGDRSVLPLVGSTSRIASITYNGAPIP